MSGKEKPSKKAVREKKKNIVEDLTFGLKNKNKSKKVQQFIERTEKSIKSSNGGSEAAKSKEAKKEAKLIKQLQEEELRVLFNEGIAGQFGKKKSKAQNSASQLGIAEANKAVSEFLEALSSESSDSDEDDNLKHQQGVIYIPDEPVVTEVFREKTIEDIIEEQRAKLAAEGKVGTPVTAETFARWRAGKLAQKQAAAEARVKAEQSKKKGGKGLSVLSGKELFNYNASLFVDDDAALDAAEENKMSVETRQLAVEEEKRLQEETERAQLEQQRLAELQQIEFEVRRQKDEERRKRAQDSNRVTFILLNVVINQVVFEEDEMEDLTPFPDEILSEMMVVEEKDEAYDDQEDAFEDGKMKGDDVDGDGDDEDEDDGDDDEEDEDDDEDDEDEEEDGMGDEDEDVEAVGQEKGLS